MVHPAETPDRRIPGSSSNRPWIGWCGLGLALLALGFLFSWSFGVDVLDEAWYLQVIRRVVSGETLYRDVCYETTPFSVYLTSLPAIAFGPTILVLKTALAFCFALTAIFSCGIIRRFDSATRGMSLFMVLFCTVYCPAYPNSVYTPLSQAMLLGSLYAAIRWIKSESGGKRRWLMAAGALA